MSITRKLQNDYKIIKNRPIGRFLFWWERVDTLRRCDFDRSERCPKSLPYSRLWQSQKAIAPFGLRRRPTFGGPHLNLTSTKQKTDLLVGFLFWWERVDSDHRRQSQQIYSLPPLATREHSHIKFCALIKKVELVDGRSLSSKVCRACNTVATHLAPKNITP